MPAWLPFSELIKILVLVIGIAAWGLNLESRVSIAENNIKQETAGYRVIQEELSKRLNRIEDKGDEARARIEQKLDNLQTLVLRRAP